MSQLLDVVLLPKTVAIIKCQAHTNGNDFISKGNASADAVARAAAKQPFVNSSHVHEETCTPTASLAEIQAKAKPAEVTQWRRCGCIKKEGV